MSLTKEKIISDYSYFKHNAISYYQKGNIEKSVKFTQLAARIGYKFNFIYTDDELEENIQCLSRKIIPKPVSFKKIKDRIVFYDSFAIDNRGLTQQYLRAIFSWNSELLFITTRKNIGNDIFKELKAYSKSEVFIVSENSFSEMIKSAFQRVTEFKPDKVFLHYSPWDIFGFTLWLQINSTDRFFINLTDHAFWLGKNTADYFLEFRNFGFNLSWKYRGIPKSKLLVQHYYPIRTITNFEGFPCETENKIIAFSGSNYYKIYGKDFFFLKVMKEVLEQNDNLLFYFAGSGNSKPLRDFIKKNKLDDRFILIGNRNDLSEVFERIDIYVNTFPLIGGLMSQYAVISKKPIVGYADPSNYSFNDTEDFLGIEKQNIIVKSTIKDFIDYFNLLINKIEVRENNIRYISNSVISEIDFNKTLRQTIEAKKIPDSQINFDAIINEEEIFDTYYDMEVNYLKEYYALIFDILGKDIFKCRINLILRTFFGIYGRIKVFFYNQIVKFFLKPL
jgi:hypothetical protein